MSRSGHGDYAPVALFVYRRLEHTRRVINDLLAMPEAAASTLYIFSDAAALPEDQAGVAEVRRLCRGLSGFAQVWVIERDNNLGCAANVIEGVSQVLAEHDRVVAVEDDLCLSPFFLSYLNRALDCYLVRKDIFSVSAFSPSPEDIGIPSAYREDVYLSHRNASTGWATWADRWTQVDWDVTDYPQLRRDRGRRRAFELGGSDLLSMLDEQMAGQIDSWAIRFSYAHFAHKAYSLCPRLSYVDHAGDDGSGTHVARGGYCRVDVSRALSKPRLPPELQPEPAVLDALQRHNSEHWAPLLLGRLPGVRSFVKGVKRWLGISGRLL